MLGFVDWQMRDTRIRTYGDKNMTGSWNGFVELGGWGQFC